MPSSAEPLNGLVRVEVKTPFTFVRELSVGGSIAVTGRHATNMKADCEARYNEVAYRVEASIAPRTLHVKLSSPLSEGPLQLDADWSPLTSTTDEQPTASQAILNVKLYGGASGRRELTARYAFAVEDTIAGRTSFAFVLRHQNRLWDQSETERVPSWFSKFSFLNSDIRFNYTCVIHCPQTLHFGTINLTKVI